MDTTEQKEVRELAQKEARENYPPEDYYSRSAYECGFEDGYRIAQSKTASITKEVAIKAMEWLGKQNKFTLQADGIWTDGLNFYRTEHLFSITQREGK